MTVFETKLYGKGTVFLPKEVRASLTKEVFLVHAGKAVLIIPKNHNYSEIMKSLDLIKKELELTSKSEV